MSRLVKIINDKHFQEFNFRATAMCHLELDMIESETRTLESLDTERIRRPSKSALKG